MSHSKRRAYPQPQYSYSAGTPAAAPPAAYGAPGAPVAPAAAAAPGQPFVPATGRATPAMAAPVDAMTAEMAGMNLGTTPAVPGVGTPTPGIPGVGAPVGGALGTSPAPAYPQQGYPQQGYSQQGYSQGYSQGYGQPAQQLSQPLNQLYNVDLSRELPPPVSDLQLPPPPLILPSDCTVTDVETNNAPPEHFRSTLNVLPTNSSLLKKSKLPLALVLSPYTSLHDSEKPVALASDQLITRCRRCRSYINPFVTFVDSGRRWKCNLCGLQNDVPAAFDYNASKGMEINRYERPELNHAVVEFVAPQEYMVRPPQPLVYVFILDVSSTAVANGLTATAARTILESLDRIPNTDGRTRVSVIAVSSALHFFTIPSGANSEENGEADDTLEAEPAMYVVGDLEEPFLPSPSDLLVPLSAARKGVEALLTRLPDMFSAAPEPGFALGPALKAAHKLVANIGAKIEVIAASLPSVGVGKLEIRDEKAALNTSKESALLLNPANSFYKSFAVDCNKAQITIDMFLCATQYQDVASLANLPRYTSGQTHFYPGWLAANPEDATKLARELSNHLSMEVGLEAVMRVRASSGVTMKSFYGNFFNRSSDLCSFPSFPRDQGYVIELNLEETITRPYVCFQAAVLHTTCHGERRIRVMNLAVPTSGSLADVYASADQQAIVAYLAQKAVEKALGSSLLAAREYLYKFMDDVVIEYKKDIMAGNVGGSSPLQLCANLRMLPLLVQSLTKHIALRSGVVPSDHRAAALALLSSLPATRLIRYIYPAVYSLHDMPDDCGVPDPATGEIKFPPTMNASVELFERYGLYLIDNTQELFLWLGGDAVPALVEDLFGTQDIFSIPIGKTELPELDTALSIRTRALIGKIRENVDSITYQSLYVVRGGGTKDSTAPTKQTNDLLALRMWAASLLVEDRMDQARGYKEYLASLREKLST